MRIGQKRTKPTQPDKNQPKMTNFVLKPVKEVESEEGESRRKKPVCTDQKGRKQ